MHPHPQSPVVIALALLGIVASWFWTAPSPGRPADAPRVRRPPTGGVRAAVWTAGDRAERVRAH